jgi:carbon monoxide dehydrogenase subunit G
MFLRFLTAAGFAALMTLASQGAAAVAAEEIQVEVHATDPGHLRLHAQVRVHASRTIAWATLTDYEHFDRFIDSLSSSRVLAHEQGEFVVEQRWQVPVWWFTVPVNLTVRSVERPPDTIDVHLVQGNLRALEGGYTLHVEGSGTVRIDWDGEIDGPGLVPRWLAAPLARQLARVQLGEMATEIERRAVH